LTSEYTWAVTGKETDAWSYEWGVSINPIEPWTFDILHVSDGLYIACSGIKYAGALAKHVGVLPYPTRTIISSTSFRFDTSMRYGQVIEIDRKFTKDGWTYDGSTQWNFAYGQVFQVGNPWMPAPGIVGDFEPDQWYSEQVKYELDYEGHTLTVAAVQVSDGPWKPVGITIPALQAGWDDNQIVTQLQLCTASEGGAYAVRFAGICDSGKLGHMPAMETREEETR
jgi:hypothetical protein